jgi:hygromycin-B 4-O-kinase
VPDARALADAEDFVRRRYGSRASGLTPLGAGGWSRAYAFTLDGRDLVVRFGAYGEDFAKDQRMADFSSALLPIPAVLELGEAPGGFFAVSRRAYGDFLDELDSDGMRAVLPRLLTALRAAWRIDLSTTDGYGGWRSDGSAPHASWRDALLDITLSRPNPRLQGWREALETSPTGAGPFDAGAAALRTLVDKCPEDRQLIHNDLLNRNILVRGGEITAVLDWGNSMYGDGAYDLALLSYAWPWYPRWSDIDIEGVITEHMAAVGENLPNLDDRLRCCQVHIALDAQAYTAFIGRWDDLAAHAWRTMTLIEGVSGTPPPAPHPAAAHEGEGVIGDPVE